MSRVRIPSIAHFYWRAVSFFQAIFLGMVQGLTEFFPISSSAHLHLARWVMGIEVDVFFDLTCHFGTLLALLIFLRADVWDVLRNFRKMGMLALALVPLIPGYFLLSPLRKILSAPSFLGYALMTTGLILYIASKKKGGFTEKKWQHVLCIGSAQMMALIPGISRSGSTIAAGRFCGWNFLEAAKFSFLLAIPTILGGEVVELVGGETLVRADWSCYVGGFLASFALGLLSVRFIFSVYEKKIVKPFAFYCFGIGLLAWALVQYGN